MCVIVIKPEGQALPDEETLLRCWTKNSDGAGIMWTDKEKKVVRISKGFMKFGGLITALHAMGDVKDMPMVLHFRIGTHGNKDATCTHPFPLTTSVDKLKQTMVECKIGIAHNGVLPCTPQDKTISDTMEFIARVLAKRPALIDPKNKEPMDLLFSMAIGTNKFVSLDGEGHMMMFGHFIEEGGLHYSNTSYKAPAVTVYKYPQHYMPEDMHQTQRDWNATFRLGYKMDKATRKQLRKARSGCICTNCEYSSCLVHNEPCRSCFPTAAKPKFLAKLNKSESHKSPCCWCLYEDRNGLDEPCKTCLAAYTDNGTYPKFTSLRAASGEWDGEQGVDDLFAKRDDELMNNMTGE